MPFQHTYFSSYECSAVADSHNSWRWLQGLDRLNQNLASSIDTQMPLSDAGWCEMVCYPPPGSDTFEAQQELSIFLLHLQTVAKAGGKLLHPQWSAIFPVYTPLARPASVTTLLDVIVSDPQPRVWLHCICTYPARALTGLAQLLS